MKEIRLQKFTLIKLIYSILIIIFLISVFLPYYSKSYAFPPPPAEPIISYTRSYLGYDELIYGGWPGLILAVISIIILNPERKGKSLLIGGIGFTLILINLMIRPTIQTITIEFGFYLSLVFSIGLFFINVFAFVSKEGMISLISDKREPIVRITPMINKKKEIEGTDWEKKEFIRTQTIDYIKKMQLKLKELPFYEIISKTGIDRDDLVKIVSDMISNKEINARVRDFIILFKKISKDKREEELQKIRNDLQQKMTYIDNLIKESRFDKAIVDLYDVIDLAKSFKLENVVIKAREKIDQCKQLDKEKREERETQNIREDFQTKMAETNNLIEKNEINAALKNLEKIRETVLKHNLQDLLEQVEEKISHCKSLESDKIKDKEQIKIKNLRVFLSYSTLDAEHFRIADIVKTLEKYPEIKKASYWQADSKQNIVEFMENTLKNTDIFALFCSKNSAKSNAVKDEWQAAFQMRKKEMLKIVPIYEDEDSIPVLLWQLLNVKFTKDNFDGFIQKLYEEIIR